jgi:ATP-dependent Zn protease
VTADDLHRRGVTATATALHEAGHVLAAFAARPAVQILQASIAPPGVRTRHRRDVSSAALERILEQLIVVDLAGGAAENQAGRWPDCHAISADERNAAARALTLITQRNPERGGVITGAMVAEAEQLVENLRLRAEETVTANWTAVECVAAALDQHKTLDAAAIEEIIGDGR